MNWNQFEEELKKRMTYSPGDLHFAGRGFWYPEPPDITTGDPAPKPPAPWVHVEMARGETKADPERSAFITSSFSKAVVSEAPGEALEVLEQVLMGFDEASGLDPISLPEPAAYIPPVVVTRRGAAVPDDEWAAEKARREAEWEKRLGPELAAKARAHAARRQRGYEEGEVVDRRPASSQFKRCNNCGASYSLQKWLILDELGTQKIEADGDEPEVTYDARNCACGSTLYAILPGEEA